jgi:hypothetical protein
VFYTLRADPRNMGLRMMTAPPTFARPVFYLDMLDVATGKLNGHMHTNGKMSKILTSAEAIESYHRTFKTHYGHMYTNGKILNLAEVLKSHYTPTVRVSP